MSNQQQDRNQERPIMNPVEAHIRRSAEAEDQSELLAVIGDATQHPESAVAAHLEVEDLRIQGVAFFNQAKGAIAHLQESRPNEIDGPNLKAYEDTIKSYLGVHDQAVKSIIGEKTDEPHTRTQSVLARLGDTIANWNKTEINKQFVVRALAGIGGRGRSAADYRTHYAHVADELKECVWEVVKLGRETSADLVTGDVSTEKVVEDYTADTDEEFELANKLVTEFITSVSNEDKQG